MKKLLFILLLLPFLSKGQTVGQFRYDTAKFYKQGGVTVLKVEGAIQVGQNPTYTTTSSASAIGQSFTLGTISSDQTITFPSLEPGRAGTFIFVDNINNSAFAWNVVGPVLERNPSGSFPISVLPTGLHIFRWDGTNWNRLGSGGGASDSTQYTSPIAVDYDNPDFRRVYLDFPAFPQDTIGVVIHNDSLFNIHYPFDGPRDSSFITVISSGSAFANSGLRMDGDTVKLNNNFSTNIIDYDAYLRFSLTKNLTVSNNDGSNTVLMGSSGMMVTTPTSQLAVQGDASSGNITSVGKWGWGGDYGYDITEDADFDADDSFNQLFLPHVKLISTITANRTFTKGASTLSGGGEWFQVTVMVDNSPFKWLLAGSTFKELDGTVLTELEPLTTYKFNWSTLGNCWYRESGGGGGFDNPMTTDGDMIYQDGGIATRLGIGTSGQVFRVSSGSAIPEWTDPEEVYPIRVGDSIFLTDGIDTTNGVYAPVAGGSGWNLNGNTVTSEKWLGTIDNFDLPIRTNNTEIARWAAGGTSLTVGATGTDFLFRKPSASGSDASASGKLYIDGGRNTGAGTPGEIVFRTSTPNVSPTTLGALVDRMVVQGGTGAGVAFPVRTTIGTTTHTGTSPLYVSTTGLFGTSARFGSEGSNDLQVGVLSPVTNVAGIYKTASGGQTTLTMNNSGANVYAWEFKAATTNNYRSFQVNSMTNQIGITMGWTTPNSPARNATLLALIPEYNIDNISGSAFTGTVWGIRYNPTITLFNGLGSTSRHIAAEFVSGHFVARDTTILGTNTNTRNAIGNVQIGAVLTSENATTTNTTDATPTTIATYPLATAGQEIEISVSVHGEQSTNHVFYKRLARAKNASGTVSIVGTPDTIGTDFEDGALTSASITVTTSGTNVIVQATGIAATTITWKVLTDIRIF